MNKFIDMKMLSDDGERSWSRKMCGERDLLQESDYVPRKLVTFQLKCTTNPMLTAIAQT
jgi:hypothetical protein